MKTLLALFALLLTTACMTPVAEIPQSAEKIQPVQTGSIIPNVTLRTSTGESFDLRKAIQKKPTVIIFYRGGWCPYCNKHLGQLQQAEDELLALGYQILAISPDRPEKLRETAGKDHLTYELLSDSNMAAARAFGIAFQVDDATVKMYKEKYKIDLEADSGETHHQLPAPSVFIVKPDGRIAFSYVNPDYKTRLSPEVLITAAKMFRQ